MRNPHSVHVDITHSTCCRLGKTEFATDVELSKALTKDLNGKPVRGTPCARRWRYFAVTNRRLLTRRSHVRVSPSAPQCYPVTSSILQVSAFGPSRFPVYVNDLSLLLRCRCRIYGDDVRLWYDIRYPLDFEILPSVLMKFQRRTEAC